VCLWLHRFVCPSVLGCSALVPLSNSCAHGHCPNACARAYLCLFRCRWFTKGLAVRILPLISHVFLLCVAVGIVSNAPFWSSWYVLDRCCITLEMYRSSWILCYLAEMRCL
jgi:hypothetical protein